MNYVLNGTVETNKTDCKLLFPVCVFEHKYNDRGCKEIYWL